MDWKQAVKNILDSNSPLKKVVGAVCIVLGFLALVTPFTPGSWLIFVGLELIGVRLAVWDKIKARFLKK